MNWKLVSQKICQNYSNKYKKYHHQSGNFDKRQINIFKDLREGEATSQFNSIQFNSIRFDSIRFDSIRFDSIRFDSIRFNSSR